MALIATPQSSFNYSCKVCRKVFPCGRALGGHMRVHGLGIGIGIADSNPEMDEDDWEAPTNKRMYALRTNPNRLKSCKVCEHCGKEFDSWKSFLEHGKCSMGEAESRLSSPEVDGEDARGCGWYRRKRSSRTTVGSFITNCPSNEDEDLANCLMMLSNAPLDSAVEPEESCASASRDEEKIHKKAMKVMVSATYKVPVVEKPKDVAGKGLFECKACKKVFNSHQALGGHRASHKKVKGCFAAKRDHSQEDSLGVDDEAFNDEFMPTKANSSYQYKGMYEGKKKSKVHECSICHRIFSTGQALGGHKRCHWITSNSTDQTIASAMERKLHQFQDHLEQSKKKSKLMGNSSGDPLELTLDLNLPVHTEEEGLHSQRMNVSEISTENLLDPWGSGEKKKKGNAGKETKRKSGSQSAEEESESLLRLAKLSEVEAKSPWLQVGIGSTRDVGAYPDDTQMG